MAAIMAGCQHAFLPLYSPRGFRDTLLQLKVTATIAVPSTLSDLVSELHRQRPQDTAVAQSQPMCHPRAEASMDRMPQCQFHESTALTQQHLLQNVGIHVGTLATQQMQSHGAPSAMMRDSLPQLNAAVTVARSEVTATGKEDLLPSMRIILVGAGLLDVELLTAVGHAMPHATILTAYGMTEATSSMTFRKVWPPHDSSTELQGLGKAEVGRPAPGIQLAIREGPATPAAAHVQNAHAVQSPSVRFFAFILSARPLECIQSTHVQ
jgi:acyl-CoA synthetase (AMP-forming)/AMP-acid ligase II